MDTKNLVILGCGIGLGYLLFKEIERRKIPPIILDFPLPSTLANAAKQKKCETEFGKATQGVRMTAEAMAAYRKDFMDKCMNDASA